MRARARAQLAVVIGIQLAAVTWLLPLARSRPIPLGGLTDWVTWTPLEELLVALAGWLGLGLALWLLATTSIALACAAAGPGARWTWTVARLAPVAVRRLCAAAAAPALMVTGLPAAVSLEAPLPPPVERGPVERGPVDTGSPSTPPEPSSGSSLVPSEMSPPSRDLDVVANDPAATKDTAVVVTPGDNLWVITARWLAAERGVACEDLDTAEIADAWRSVVRANTPRLRSGDPDLIFPGESVLLASS